MNNLTEILHQTSLEFPDRIAVRLLHSQSPEQAFTYRALFHRSVEYSRAIEGAGVQPGEVVILILEHGLDLLAAFLGSIMSGAVPSIMPFLTEKLRPEQYRTSLAALFEITAPAIVITYLDFVGEVHQARQGSSVRDVLIAEYVMDHVPEQVELNFNQMSGMRSDPGEIVLLQHSSGTTGLQKGVALSHQAVINQLNSYRQALNLMAEDVIVSWLPLYHDMGLIAGFLLPILERIPLVLLSPFDWVRAPYRLMQALSTYRGTLCWLPNFAYNFCAQKVRDHQLEGVNLSSLRAVINCSEPIYWKSHDMFLERFAPYGLNADAIATSYAMAENVFAVTQGGIHERVRTDEIDLRSFLENHLARPATSGSTIKFVSSGKPIQNVQIRVIDSNGENLPERTIGEIALQSDCMLTEYYNRNDLTQNVFLDGWYLTGDLGYLADNQLYVTGRKKDLIIVGGKNVYPQDLERLAGEVPGVYPGRVVAFGVFNETSGTEDVVVVAEIDKEFAPEYQDDPYVTEITTQIRQRVTLGSDIALRHVTVVPHNWLIKTSSGKIARNANRQKYIDLVQRT